MQDPHRESGQSMAKEEQFVCHKAYFK
ncbi:hypothetical protein A2U01_0105668, partial [Trifolium medium]|nr:hypothetical protein [Trifolium medium]